MSTPQLKQCAREQLAFINIFAARLWHDLHDSKVFIDYLRDKITRKLLKVKVSRYRPAFDVKVNRIRLGTHKKVNKGRLLQRYKALMTFQLRTFGAGSIQ